MYLELCTENFLHELSMPESVWTHLKLCHYNLFLWPGTNQKWSKHRFHWYIVCHALERHGGAIGGKTWAETLQKGELWHKMEIIVLKPTTLLKANNEKSRTMCVICSKLTKKHQKDLIDLKILRNNEVALVSLLLTSIKFHTFP